MSQYVETPTRAFAASSALGQHLRVKMSAGVLALAGATDVEIGTLDRPVVTGDEVGTVRLRSAQGTRKMVAAGAITANNPVYAAASGKVDASGTVFCGTALEASTANGDVIEVLPGPNTDVSAAITGTTAASFTVDSDASTPKISLAAQTGGTGNFTTTLKPETTLSGNNAIIVPEADTDTLVAAALAQTLTNKTLSTGTKDLRDTTTLTPNSSEGAGNSMTAGLTQYTVTTVTNDANDFVVLPAIASVGIGHTIVIACNAGGNFELRTPASSNTKINDVDSDGSQEYLCTDTDLIIVRKHTTTSWVAQSLTKLGAVRTAVVPD